MNDFYEKQIVKHGYWWSGDYDSWSNAETECLGYSEHHIVEQVKDTLLITKDREDIYERDGCIINGEPEYAFELLHWIKESSVNNEINLIDFGGSLGTTYHQLKKYLKDYRVRWNVIEQKNYVEVGKKTFENENLKFYNTIEECITETTPNCFISSSAIPYIESSYDILSTIINYNFEWVLLDRISVIDGDKDRITIQIVPPDIYKAIYPCWFFSEKKLINTFLKGDYEHIKTFYALGGKNFAPKIDTSAYKGFIFKLKK